MPQDASSPRRETRHRRCPTGHQIRRRRKSKVIRLETGEERSSSTESFGLFDISPNRKTGVPLATSIQQRIIPGRNFPQTKQALYRPVFPFTIRPILLSGDIKGFFGKLH
jgi:hypothetical protein